MATGVIKDLIEAGIHFGHRASRWNPKMKPYILSKRSSIHIIDPKQTLKGLLIAKKFVTRTIGQGKDLLLVGTKRQARKAVEDGARRVSMHFVNDRWLGGTLTNYRTIRSRLTRLEKLEQLEADGLMEQQSKKEAARLRREMRKIKRNLDGLRHMDALPGAMFVVDARRETIALREARKLGIPTLALLDTDSDPDMVDIPIPGNDDAMRAIQLVVDELCKAAELGVAARTDKGEPTTVQAPASPRRSRRAVMGRAAEPTPAAPTEQAAAPAPTPVEQAPAPAPASEPPAPAAPEDAPASTSFCGSILRRRELSRTHATASRTSSNTPCSAGRAASPCAIRSSRCIR